MNESKQTRIDRLERFYWKVAKLTRNSVPRFFDDLNGESCVKADQLENALSEIDKKWWDKSKNINP